ncbi:unnamed protein product [Albugo candida]|uniref:Uncharacterized protein n=1 Tax=Albugo candida TaxID=65357 RepID=A0A024FU89_9STRA|nr:unnamed protein product [Albugo candida]|eukprot:CCI10591.1 unnamed protein product [Albugo candida]
MERLRRNSPKANMKVPIKRIHVYRSHCSRCTAVQADKQYDRMMLDRSEQSKERLHENQLCDLMNFDHRSTATKRSLLQPHPFLHSIACVHQSLSIKFCNKSNDCFEWERFFLVHITAPRSLERKLFFPESEFSIPRQRNGSSIELARMVAERREIFMSN